MTVTHTHGTRRTPRWIILSLALALLAALLPLIPQAARAESSTFYFESTGQTLGGPLYDAWVNKGGRSKLGDPVSPLVQTDGRWVQWFEYARLDVTVPDLAQATESDIAAASIGRVVADRLGVIKSHPAFQPYGGPITEDMVAFDTGHVIVNGFREMHEREGVTERLGRPISQEFTMRGATYQFFEGGALTWTEQDGVEFARLGILGAALHGTLRLTGEQPEGIATYEDPTFAPIVYSGERWIDVNLGTYLLTAYEGSTPVLSTYIVDGGWNTPTVTGTFYIYSKIDSQTMRGNRPDGSEYVTEDVPYVMYFYADYAIHGAYWRSSFGYSASQGCVNVPVSTAAWLYGWAGYGTRVEVHY